MMAFHWLFLLLLGACYSCFCNAAPNQAPTTTDVEETWEPQQIRDCGDDSELCRSQDLLIEICRSNPQLCGTDDNILEEIKRGAQTFSNWGGKRVPFQSWGGKRVPFQSWGGKRVPFQSWGGKRVPFQSWGGKRSVDAANRGSNFHSWGGKRLPFQSWGGKRDAVFSSWGGKRSAEEQEQRDKRAAGEQRTKLNRLLAGSETVAIRRGTVDFFPWGGKRTSD